MVPSLLGFRFLGVAMNLALCLSRWLDRLSGVMFPSTGLGTGGPLMCLSSHLLHSSVFCLSPWKIPSSP